MFQPGESGNPGGRPRLPSGLRRAFQEASFKGFLTLWEVMNDAGGSEAGRLKAAETILKYAWGDPAKSEAEPAPSDLEVFQLELPLDLGFFPTKTAEFGESIMRALSEGRANKPATNTVKKQ